MGAYLSAVQSACYGAVWAHRRHGQAHGGPPSNNGNRGAMVCIGHFNPGNKRACGLASPQPRASTARDGKLRQRNALLAPPVLFLVCLPACWDAGCMCHSRSAPFPPGPGLPN